MSVTSSDDYFIATEKALSELRKRCDRWQNIANEYYAKESTLDDEQRVYAEKADIRAFCYGEAIRILEKELEY